MLTRLELARRIYASSNLKGVFVLRSGALSNEYFDKYRFESVPALLREIVIAMAELVPVETEILAGLELGGVPLATALCQATGLPAAFVRKTAKTYGTCKLAEGASVEGKNVLVIEDVVTSGGQIVQSVTELRKLGAEVSSVLCVIDRESGAAGVLEKEGLSLRALFSMSELRSAAGI
ncbi:MAG: orotate phosphoribosyltransferase [Candidatus Hydrogenedentes bacterium]|nr:orotate phosphoribosyltransferase [Candidatus Hydrogenedentota bacterium]